MHPSYLPLLILTFLCHWFVAPRRYRALLLLAASLVWSAVCTGPFFPLLLGLVGATALFVRALGNEKRSGLLLGGCLLLLVGNLVLFKTLSSVRLLQTGFLFPIGLSYATFRMIHVIVDVYFGRLAPMPVHHLMAYVLFFPTFVAGPVDRYKAFQVEQGPLDLRYLNLGLLRIGVGIVKKALAADRLRLLVYPAVGSASLLDPVSFLAVSYGLLLVLYLDFSAYSDVAIGSSYMFGIKVMENFDYPLLKPSLPEFWRSWHISVYTFIRDYFLFPLFGSRSSEAKLYLGLVLSFVVFMLWHRISWVFLGLGLYLGLPVAATAAFARLKARRPRLRKALRNRALRPIFVLLTVTYIAVGTFILHWDGYLTATVR